MPSPSNDKRQLDLVSLGSLEVVALRIRDSYGSNGAKACETRQALSYFLCSDENGQLTIDDLKFFRWLATNMGFSPLHDALALQTSRGSLELTGIRLPGDFLISLDSIQQNHASSEPGSPVFLLIYPVASANLPHYPDGHSPEEVLLDLIEQGDSLLLHPGPSSQTVVRESLARPSKARNPPRPTALSASSSSCTSTSSKGVSSATTVSCRTRSAKSTMSAAPRRLSSVTARGDKKKADSPSVPEKVRRTLARSVQATASSKNAKANGASGRGLGFQCRNKAAMSSDDMTSAPKTAGAAAPRPADKIEVDAGYAAMDDTNVDATLGSYNQDASEEVWRQCLDFFCLDPVEYANREARDAQACKTGGHLPVKKLHGFRGGLFDYQLSAVFQMLGLLRKGVRGGFLADEMGLGKSIEMLGIQSVRFSLRSMVDDIGANPGRHSFSGSACKAEGRYMIRCPCYHGLARELADLVDLDGPTVIVAPASTSEQMFQMAKQRLDPKIFEVRLVGAAATVDGALSAADMRALACKTVKNPVPGEPDLRSGGGFGQNKFVIVCPDSKCKELLLHRVMPAAVFMDEFHQYTQSGSPVERWLKLLQTVADGRSPAFYFVGGTPVEGTPADLRAQLARLEQPSWSQGPMKVATVSALDSVIARYNELQQQMMHKADDGLCIRPRDIGRYHVQLSEVLRSVMVRRLATDSFRGRILALKPMCVNIHQVPVLRRAQGLVQACSAAARSLAASKMGSDDERCIGQYLDSDLGEEVLERLRLASFFPQAAAWTAKDGAGSKPACSLLERDIVKHMQTCKSSGRGIEKSRYWDRVDEFTANSAKLDTLKTLIRTMLDDKTQIPNEHCRAKKMCIITPTEGEAMLIFAYLKKMTRDARPTAAKPKPVWLHSAMASSEAAEVVRAFKQKGNATANILVAPLSRAGTGLDLPQASYLVLTGLGWRKRDNKQAFYRIHRAGQCLDTHLHLMVSRGNPAERRIWARHAGGMMDRPTAWEVFAETDVIPDDELPDAVKDAVGNVISEAFNRVV